jgi:hypothetical protein
MCPANIPQPILDHLLNSGIPYYGRGDPKEHPHSIFNVYRGVPYRAVRTVAGRSFHGFPCISKRKDVPPGVLPAILKKAEELGVKEQVEKWFKEHP